MVRRPRQHRTEDCPRGSVSAEAGPSPGALRAVGSLVVTEAKSRLRGSDAIQELVQSLAAPNEQTWAVCELHHIAVVVGTPPRANPARHDRLDVRQRERPTLECRPNDHL